MDSAIKNLNVYIENTPDGWLFKLATKTRSKLFAIPDRPKNKFFSLFIPHLVRQKMEGSNELLDDFTLVDEIVHGLVGYRLMEFESVIFIDSKSKVELKVIKAAGKRAKLSNWAISDSGTLIHIGK